jgi:hypothetical protein
MIIQAAHKMEIKIPYFTEADTTEQILYPIQLIIYLKPTNRVASVVNHFVLRSIASVFIMAPNVDQIVAASIARIGMTPQRNQALRQKKTLFLVLIVLEQISMDGRQQ